MTAHTRREALSLAAAALVVPAAPALAAGAPAAPNPDAEVILLAEAFIAAEQEAERLTAPIDNKEGRRTPEDEAFMRRFDAVATRYHERLAEITEAEVTTPLGLLAQAKVALWITRDPTDDERHLWNLADSVFTVLRAPLPDWAEEQHGPHCAAPARAATAAPVASPDDALVAACAEHLAAKAAVREAERTNPDLGDHDPAMIRYGTAFDRVDAAPSPTTMAGILVLARSAAAESRNNRGGPREWDDPSGAWAGDAVLSLLRLHGEAVE